MIENIKGVRNPLSIIAIFAGLAEISGTCILPFIAVANQATYIWFLMIFPAVLVALFFTTLNFNSKVLYAPSDFRDEANYMKMFQPSTTAQKNLKIQEEVAEEAEPLNDAVQAAPQPKAMRPQQEILDLMRGNPRLRYELVENFIINILSREFQTLPQRYLSLREGITNFTYDAVFHRKEGITVVEVKYTSKKVNIFQYKDTLSRIQLSLKALPENIQKNAQVVLAIAHEMSDQESKVVKQNLESITTEYPIPVLVRMFSLPELLKEFD